MAAPKEAGGVYRDEREEPQGGVEHGGPSAIVTPRRLL